MDSRSLGLCYQDPQASNYQFFTKTMDNKERKRRSVDFSIKAAWLAISKMYNTLGADYDISHSTGFVLLNIDRENGTPATKIAPLLGMEARSLTRMLKTLEDKGYIIKEADEFDKRKVIIKLTETGKVKREMSRQTVKVFHKKLEDALTAEQLKSFFEVTDTIHDLLDNPDNGILEEVQQRMEGLVEVERASA